LESGRQDKVVNGNATDASEAERKESSWRLGPVSEISVERSNTDDTDDDGKVNDGEHQIDGRRYLQKKDSKHSNTGAYMGRRNPWTDCVEI